MASKQLTRRPTIPTSGGADGDPAVRKDKRCARFPVCKEKLREPTRYSGWTEDPFCSTECCKIYHGAVKNSPT